MKRIVITYGLIAGAIVSVMLVISMPLHENGTLNMDSGMWVGYTTMVIAMSMIFFGVKNYRDNYTANHITFGDAFKVGIAITLVASLLYATTWQVYYHFKGTEFNEWYMKCELDALIEDGASPEALQEKKAEVIKFSKLYENPFVRFGFTLMEILPVGLLFTLLTAAILRKRKV
jgi:hypothetical protein